MGDNCFGVGLEVQGDRRAEKGGLVVENYLRIYFCFIWGVFLISDSVWSNYGNISPWLSDRRVSSCVLPQFLH